MEFRGLYETGIKTRRNIRSVARLSDRYGRLKSKAALDDCLPRGALRLNLLKFL